MSSTDVPWPGRRGSSTAKPAVAKASASPRIDCGLPVKPCSTSTPWGPPGADQGSAQGMTGARLTGGSDIWVIGTSGVCPPVFGSRRPPSVLDDAVDGANGQALL